MTVAVIDIKTNKIIATIVASENDTPYPGTIFRAAPQDKTGACLIDTRYQWSEKDGFVPGPELAAEIAAEAAKEESRRG